MNTLCWKFWDLFLQHWSFNVSLVSKCPPKDLIIAPNNVPSKHNYSNLPSTHSESRYCSLLAELHCHPVTHYVRKLSFNYCGEIVERAIGKCPAPEVSRWISLDTAFNEEATQELELVEPLSSPLSRKDAKKLVGRLRSCILFSLLCGKKSVLHHSRQLEYKYVEACVVYLYSKHVNPGHIFPLLLG